MMFIVLTRCSLCSLLFFSLFSLFLSLPRAGQRKRCALKAGEHCKKTCAAFMANKSQSQVQSDSAKPEGQTVVQRMAANIDQGNGKKNKELSKELRLSKQQAVLK